MHSSTKQEHETITFAKALLEQKLQRKALNLRLSENKLYVLNSTYFLEYIAKPSLTKTLHSTLELNREK